MEPWDIFEVARRIVQPTSTLTMPTSSQPSSSLTTELRCSMRTVIGARKCSMHSGR